MALISYAQRRVSAANLKWYLLQAASLLYGVVLIGSLLTYHAYDASWFFYSSTTVAPYNMFGTFGANTAALLFYLFGFSAYFFIVQFIVMYSYIFVYKAWRKNIDRIIASSLLPLICAALSYYYAYDLVGAVPGGLLGYTIYTNLVRVADSLSVIIGLHCVITVCFLILLQDSFMQLVRKLGTLFCAWGGFKKVGIIVHGALEYLLNLIIRPLNFLLHSVRQIFGHLFTSTSDDTLAALEYVARSAHQGIDTIHEQDFWQILTKKNDSKQVLVQESPHKKVHATRNKDDNNTLSAENNVHDKYKAPPLTFFVVQEDERDAQHVERELHERAKLLEEKLERFGISGQVTAIKRGPVVTLFEYKPDINAKISKIIALEDDLALALQAMSIRIMAPIPGKSVVGFEVANTHRKNVLLADIIHSAAYANAKIELPLIIGKDTSGLPVVVDLVKMPHLLVAGSTGSGKSVGLNAMLISLLCKRSPQELRFVLIDPKRLEFTAYADIAHLLFPVVTNPKESIGVLHWIVKEMELRYASMATHGVRNIQEYNAKVSQEERKPYIVVMIDELADLMMTAGRELEGLIARITQMARAAGIHMVVATQRPSVDIITGLIKVNFPSRISFRVTSKVDSRTILDCSGADKLLGRGDMLFLDSSDSQLKRVHGAYVSDKEIMTVVNHIKEQQEPSYLDLAQELPLTNAYAADVDDVLYDEIKKFLHEVDEVSISLLQRRFRIGYNRSARIIDLLESRGLIMPSTGGKTRKVIR